MVVVVCSFVQMNGNEEQRQLPEMKHYIILWHKLTRNYTKVYLRSSFFLVVVVLIGLKRWSGINEPRLQGSRFQKFQSFHELSVPLYNTFPRFIKYFRSTELHLSSSTIRPGPRHPSFTKIFN